MGACSKKIAKRDPDYTVKPETYARAEDTNGAQITEKLVTAVETEIPQQRPESPVEAEKPIDDEPWVEEPPKPLIRHYQDRDELVSRYQQPTEERKQDKKKSIIVAKKTDVAPIQRKSEESSFEASGELAEGVVGTVH